MKNCQDLSDYQSGSIWILWMEKIQIVLETFADTSGGSPTINLPIFTVHLTSLTPLDPPLAVLGALGPT